MTDPRHPNEEVPVIAFYYPGKPEAWDNLCKGGFLGNFWEVGVDGISLPIIANDNKVSSYTNAEAAFQALKFPNDTEAFRYIDGDAAFNLKRSDGYAGHEDHSYSGFGGNWKGMLNVLYAKFSIRPGHHGGNQLAIALYHTGDSYLLEHNATSGRDKVWSDNSDGKGMNWLGLQLMIVRDYHNWLWGKRMQPSHFAWSEWMHELGGTQMQPSRFTWSRWIQEEGLINLESGVNMQNYGQAAYGAWQASVQLARDQLVKALGGPQQQKHPCAAKHLGCQGNSWNNKEGNHCSKKCRLAQKNAV